MVYRNERDFQRIGQRLCKRDSNKKRPDEAGTGCNCYGIQVLQGNTPLFQRFLSKRMNNFYMTPACKLRDNTAILSMDVPLESNNTGQDLSSVFQNRRCSLITGCLYGKDVTQSSTLDMVTNSIPSFSKSESFSLMASAVC